MTRKKTLTKAGAAAGALVLLASTAAMAGPPTYLTVNGVGGPSAAADFNGVGSGWNAFVTNPGIITQCATSNLTGKVYRGTLVDAGMPIGRITGISGTCGVSALNFPVTMSQIGGSWNIEVKSTPASAGDPIAVEISNMAIRFDGGTPCSFDIAASKVDATLYPGPTGGHDARLEFNTTPNYPFDVTSAPPSTCIGLINHTNFMAFTGTYNLDTTGAITGPISHG